ncbi:hypothetical protein BTA51_26585 [Hahella sp. CCB-MM4]|uniref:hypothetical protein n=1 Tax=Hahella sp. (strain CCB-MM4) TaxID=1926491 RepID=UPI000B9B1F71|nr:hypothetical protein [Hahella sp. CCB-MM4]OZG70291.1 hypothetical protein BTA51_26585 [Hahella sp. CCB-MM4]
MRPFDATTIDRLRIRGHRQHCDQIQRELTLMDWPEPSDHAWVFVRSLHIQAPAHRAVAAVKSGVRQVVAQTGNSDNIKRFATLDELLAALVSDLLMGTAGQHWYWQRWSHLFSGNLSSALRTLLAEYIDQTAAVIERLHYSGLLKHFWQTLTDADAEALCIELTYQGGYRLQQFPYTDLPPPIDLTDIPSSRCQAWQYSLAGLPAQSARQQWVFWLVARQFWPLALAQAPKETLQAVYHWWRRQQFPEIDKTETHHPNQVPGTTKNASWQTSPKPAAQVESFAKDSITLSEADKTAEKFKEASPIQNIPSPREQSTESGDAPTNFSTLEPADNTETPPAQPLSPQGYPDTKASSDQTEKAEPQFHQTWSVQPSSSASKPLQNIEIEGINTHQGGVLYLLNVLRRPEMQSILSDFWSIYPSGWFWLFRLAEMLNLDLEDPLAQLILAEMGVDKEHPLSSLPELPEAEHLKVILAQWYDPESLWNPQLLDVSARIQASPSHIDLFAPMNQVRLDVRLAGLDVNPGWLPWLGRVVQFHFQEQGS